MQGRRKQLALCVQVWEKADGTEYAGWEYAVATKYAVLEEPVGTEYKGWRKQLVLSTGWEKAVV
jgi:hypothetical protein